MLSLWAGAAVCAPRPQRGGGAAVAVAAARDAGADHVCAAARALAAGRDLREVTMATIERIEVLKKRNQWKEGDRVQGLRKTKPDV